jgi:hypothetical protein
MDKKLIVAGLCGPGRHEMPVQEYLYPNMVENPMDFEGLYNHAHGYITQLQFEQGCPLHVMLFVTGLTPVLTSFLSAWKKEADEDDLLTLMHFNRDTGLYVAQDF